ncbi:DMT family transporter [Thalassobacillus sp. B23F22_16]|uniref:DMT family transporter n=1 Tax=Thalassobacillus sp. B23F22_16 TaxID=3459513 RepID=UPI00373DFD28
MKKAILFVLIGASLWGTIGLYVKMLEQAGFTSMEIVTIRVFFASVFLLGYMLLRYRKQMKLKNWKDIRYFIGTGIGSIVFFNYCLFASMAETNIPIATALLYTGPAFVMILSIILFKEPYTAKKGLALGLTLVGAAFAVGAFPSPDASLSTAGILLGIGSGFGYALYSIFSKFAFVKYDSLTITFYTFITATAALLPFFPYQEKLAILLSPGPLLLGIGLGLLPTAVAYISYTLGLFEMEASKASILSTIEPVVAIIIGITVFDDAFNGWQMAGMLAIISAVVVISKSRKRVKITARV